MRVRTLDFDEALRADRLLTASCLVEVWRIVEKADRTLCGILVEKNFKRFIVDEGVKR